MSLLTWPCENWWEWNVTKCIFIIFARHAHAYSRMCHHNRWNSNVFTLYFVLPSILDARQFHDFLQVNRVKWIRMHKVFNWHFCSYHMKALHAHTHRYKLTSPFTHSSPCPILVLACVPLDFCRSIPLYWPLWRRNKNAWFFFHANGEKWAMGFPFAL